MAKPERLIDRVYENFSVSAQTKTFFVYDIRGDVARWSPAALELVRLPGEYITNAMTMFEAQIHPEDRNAFREGFQRVKKGEQPRYAASYRIQDKSGEFVTCDLRVFIVRDYANRPAYLSVAISNRGRNARLDTVTDLPNRFDYFSDLRDKKDFKKPTVTVMIGTTNFATVNRLYGYNIGNRILKDMADMTVKLVGEKAKAYRAQGASLLLLTGDLSVEEIRAIYSKLRTFARNDLNVDGTNVALEIAGGAVVLDDFEIDEHTVYTCARFALEQSVQGRGRNLVVIRNDQVNEGNRTLSVINALRTSIANNCQGFYLVYQPLVSSVSGMLEGVEVLLRYENAKFGQVAPGLFIPAIEKDEAFSKLGTWIIERACMEGKDLLDSFPELQLHINLDYMQLEETRFRHTLLDILTRTGFPGKNICLELSETCKTLSPLFLRDEIYFFKSCGIKTALDGSCLTSLNLIRELPVDMIKVDRDMIANIEKNPTDQYMLEAVTGFARKMHIDVCVEGVETESTKNFLKRFPVSVYQGYYYSEPVRLQELRTLPLFRIAAV
ncbi:MAG: EAL domain-containing protein [Lachnospiraceae bacterium]|nr:EAL domain-containing protein [Lachnospiraceae bacterium]